MGFLIFNFQSTKSQQNSVKIFCTMTPLEAVFIFATFVAHAIRVTIYPLDEEDDGYESDAAQFGEGEGDRDESWEAYDDIGWLSVGKRKMNNDEGVVKKVKTF